MLICITGEKNVKLSSDTYGGKFLVADLSKRIFKCPYKTQLIIFEAPLNTERKNLYVGKPDF